MCAHGRFVYSIAISEARLPAYTTDGRSSDGLEFRRMQGHEQELRGMAAALHAAQAQADEAARRVWQAMPQQQLHGGYPWAAAAAAASSSSSSTGLPDLHSMAPEQLTMMTSLKQQPPPLQPARVQQRVTDVMHWACTQKSRSRGSPAKRTP